MTSLEQLKRFYSFNDWANRRMIAALRRSGCEPARKYLAHVLITEKEYYERLHGKDSTGFDFWPDLDIDELSALAKENAELFEKLLAKFDDEGLGQTVDYKTSGGTGYKNTFGDMLAHVVLHSTAHRAQILTLLRQNGFEPPVVDYIIYRRELQ